MNIEAVLPGNVFVESGPEIPKSQIWEWEVWGWIWGFMTHSAFANLIAFAAFGVSLWSLRNSSPRLKIKLKGALVVDPKIPRWSGKSAVFITVTNHGSAPAYIQNVYLTSRLGSLSANYVDVHSYGVDENRSVPVEIAPYGGSENWIINREEMRDFAARDAGNTEVKFRAAVKSGRKTLKSRTVEPVHPNEPQQHPRRKKSFRKRMKNLFKSLFVPHPIPQSASGWGSRIEDIDLENNKYRIRVRNLGGGWVIGAVLELHASASLGTYRKKLVGEPIPIPRLGRKQECLIWVPFAAEENQTWYVRFNGRTSSQGIGATTRTKVERAIAEMDGQS